MASLRWTIRITVFLSVGAAHAAGVPCYHVKEQYIDPALGSLKDCQKLFGHRFEAFMKAYCPALYKCWMKAASTTERPGTISPSDTRVPPSTHFRSIHVLMCVLVALVAVLTTVGLVAVGIWKCPETGSRLRDLIVTLIRGRGFMLIYRDP